ncbi:FKBP-type peptidyl-prolyl cis-trans isomerase [Hymenobacter sp. J193]|uniref:FKBP-type peptidyl-prolyl cis-trans isomerase n=1 Tax=Hymenobacter sp. J193 TaxID=2898429 RepID=UPI0021512F94|nr:FKBP-type peptidyl-prolyl cis-trans isomerase [Hymenobacter sp. J193]MCR5887381.1 FKBP-type peptidyl-prolyl cis-trans isomerase [Hymenobacter sp. J193]
MRFNSTFLYLALASGTLSLASCEKGNKGFDKTKSGIEYQLFANEGGKYSRKEIAATDTAYKSRIGKVLALNVEYRTAKDSVLFSSRKQQGTPVMVPLQELTTKGGLEDAISLLQPGDSGVFRFNLDTIFAKSFRVPVPPFMKKAGNIMTVYAKATKLMTRDEAMVEQQKMMAVQQQKMMAYAEQQMKKDDVVLQDYIKKNNLKAEKDASGIYYVIAQQGTGAKPKSGQTVSVQYKGTLLDGKEFDSSAKSNGGKPIEFPLGVGQVIPGWDKGIALLNKGTKATLLIPSSLAYGQRGAGADIPADAVLRFDVELVDVK